MLFCEKTEELANRERHNNRILNKHGSTSRTYNTVEFVVLESKPSLVQSSRSNRLLLGFKCKQLELVIFNISGNVLKNLPKSNGYLMRLIKVPKHLHLRIIVTSAL